MRSVAFNCRAHMLHNFMGHASVSRLRVFAPIHPGCVHCWLAVIKSTVGSTTTNLATRPAARSPPGIPRSYACDHPRTTGTTCSQRDVKPRQTSIRSPHAADPCPYGNVVYYASTTCGAPNGTAILTVALVIYPSGIGNLLSWQTSAGSWPSD